jgi:hypothetical protein
MGQNSLQTSSLVDFMERTASTKIQALRATYPTEDQLLSTARELGPSGQGEWVELSDTKRAALIELIISNLQQLKQRSEDLIHLIRSKMKLVNRTKMVGGIIATMSGGFGATLVFFDVGQNGTALATAIIAMIGGLATLFAEYFEKAPSGIRIATAEEHGRLVEAHATIERIERRVNRDALITLSDEELGEMVGALDDFADRIVRLSFA